MAEGWIKLYRNIQEHWIWQDPQKLKWWLDIILLANHKENKFLLGNELIEVERGEHHTSELKLAKRWGVSKTTVRKFLKLLESEQMIELKKSKKGTTLKVSKYNDYQDFSEGEKTVKKPQKNHSVYYKETIEEPYAIPQKNHEVYTNNNEKKEKNEKNEKEGEEKKFSPAFPRFYPSPIHELLANSDSLSPVSYKTFFENADIKEEDGVIKINLENEFSKGAIQKYIPTLEIETHKKIEVI
ncbi:GntR family transcriptional regulator [Clostridium perfringens]|uniref:GntR family transcriptional regulator n=1 Tax=Clostridium perfringens TaxID=1502 RepID=UPI002449D10A|nr:GntR family transcriptional regulator [Clostridium perfringens]MDH2339168.1 GntR family transcriptional regulator [Clostridium perfringens]MDM0691022.1 GntR family transcriptional regulator [Clostridium perfringens]MDM0696847.1 GntR family transcriptional regulator [Clostridium perfringens]MDN4736460.1 GntR family transcriptional regulator [Clostridium perfringens]MDN4739923.1 GntR family transcriptional regulator [Clostridium perfringens]